MITRILSTDGSTKLQDLNYTYDAAGNVKSINSESYTYDWLNRMASSSGPWGITNYTYDGVGNMLTLKMGSAETNYTYGSYNRLIQAGSANFTYDADGNTIKQVNGSNTWTYSYDYENRLTGVTLNGKSVQNNTYTGDGKRVSQTVSGSPMVYVYDGLKIIYEKNLTSGLVTDLYYGDNVQLAKTVGSLSYYFLKDRLASTRVEVDSSGRTVFSSNYEPFGMQYGSSGVESFMYTGKYYDSSTGLYYYNTRFYDSTIQRFMTEDTYHGSNDNPQSLNRYTYVLNNPETLVDPTGHETLTVSWGWNEPGYDETRRQSASVTVSAQLGADSVQVSWNLPATNTYVEWWGWFGRVILTASLIMVGIQVYVNPAPGLPLSWGICDGLGEKQVWWAGPTGSTSVNVYWVPGYWDWDNPYSWGLWASFDSDDTIYFVITPYYGYNLMPQPGISFPIHP